MELESSSAVGAGVQNGSLTFSLLGTPVVVSPWFWVVGGILNQGLSPIGCTLSVHSITSLSRKTDRFLCDHSLPEGPCGSASYGA